MSDEDAFADEFAAIVRENRRFLRSAVRDVVGLTVDLVNDAIDFIGRNAKGGSTAAWTGTSAMHFFGYHGLTPGSHSLHANLLIGGLPGCFRELRFMTELLAKCWLADARNSSDSLFSDKLEAIESEKPSGGGRKREIDFIREFDEQARLGGIAVTLWRRLSEEIHARKYVQRFVDRLAEKGTFSGYSLVLPMVYSAGDEGELNELAVYVREFREVLKRSLQGNDGMKSR